MLSRNPLPDDNHELNLDPSTRAGLVLVRQQLQQLGVSVEHLPDVALLAAAVRMAALIKENNDRVA